MNTSRNNDDFNTTVNPFTGEEIDSFRYHSRSEAEDILNSSHKTFEKWSQQSLESRKQIITNFSDEVKKEKNEIAKLMTMEMGKTYAQSQAEVDRCISIINHCVEYSEEYLADKAKEFPEGKALVTYQPQGIILGIQPWNFPLYQAIRYAVPNLLAGNTVLLKHARNVWGTAMMIEKLFERAQLPKNAFSVIKLRSDDMDFLYESKKIRGVTFTGSSEAGAIIAKKAGENLKKTVLELGGNDAYIVLDGANLESAVSACIKGRLNNNGQTCICAKRFLVEESIYGQFKEMFLNGIKNAKSGDPMNSDTDIGPLARKDLVDKLDKQVKKSLEMGAVCLYQAKENDGKGYFYPATILESLKPGMPAYDDELFGPVASLIKVKDLDHAIDVANSSRFGLGGGIFGADQEQLIEVAKKKLDTGMVNINGYGSANANIPFGGVKDSGYGREFSHLGFHEFINIKSIMVHENNGK